MLVRPVGALGSLVLVLASLAILIFYNYFANANYFRTHITGIPQARGLVRVIDFPETQEFAGPHDTFIDLGFRYDLWSGGEWVALLNSGIKVFRPKKLSTQYNPLSDAELAKLLKMAGMKDTPQVPPRSWSVLWVDEIALLLLLGCGCFCIASLRNSEHPVAATPSFTAAPSDVSPKPVDEAIKTMTEMLAGIRKVQRPMTVFKGVSDMSGFNLANVGLAASTNHQGIYFSETRKLEIVFDWRPNEIGLPISRQYGDCGSFTFYFSKFEASSVPFLQVSGHFDLLDETLRMIFVGFNQPLNTTASFRGAQTAAKKTGLVEDRRWVLQLLSVLAVNGPLQQSAAALRRHCKISIAEVFAVAEMSDKEGGKRALYKSADGRIPGSISNDDGSVLIARLAI